MHAKIPASYRLFQRVRNPSKLSFGKPFTVSTRSCTSSCSSRQPTELFGVNCKLSRIIIPSHIKSMHAQKLEERIVFYRSLNSFGTFFWGVNSILFSLLDLRASGCSLLMLGFMTTNRSRINRQFGRDAVALIQKKEFLIPSHHPWLINLIETHQLTKLGFDVEGKLVLCDHSVTDLENPVMLQADLDLQEEAKPGPKI